MTGSFSRPKFSASWPGGRALSESHQKFWLSSDEAGVVAPAEGVEVRVAEQGVGDQLRLLDLLDLDVDAGVLPHTAGGAGPSRSALVSVIVE